MNKATSTITPDVEMGTLAVCKMCGKPIEYVGPYWRHIGYSPRHPAIPFKAQAALDAAGGQE